MECIKNQHGNVTFKASDVQDKETLKDIQRRVGGNDVAFLSEMLDSFGFSGNGVFVPILPEEVGALTDAPMFSDGVDSLDLGQRVVYGDVWWFHNYQVEDFAESLLETGEVTFTKAEKV